MQEDTAGDPREGKGPLGVWALGMRQEQIHRKSLMLTLQNLPMAGAPPKALC